MSKGHKYEATKNLDIASIAKLIRDDIKAALKEYTLLPGTKCAVRISRYAGGQSLNVTITAFPAQITSDEYIQADERTFFGGDRHTVVAQSTRRILEHIVEAYNYNNSDISTDYFSVRFYGDVQFGHDLSRADREASEARLARITNIGDLTDLRLADMAMAAASNF